VDARILLVEDDPSIRKITALSLREAASASPPRPTAPRGWRDSARIGPPLSCST
jgi:hypothetical protein